MSTCEIHINRTVKQRFKLQFICIKYLLHGFLVEAVQIQDAKLTPEILDILDDLTGLRLMDSKLILVQ